MGSLKRCGNIKPNELSKLRINADEKWNKANRLIAASCEGTYKKGKETLTSLHSHHGAWQTSTTKTTRGDFTLTHPRRRLSGRGDPTQETCGENLLRAMGGR